MSNKAYRATRVNEVNWEQIARGKEGLGVTVGIDLGKFDLSVICRWADGRFERPWRVKNPWARFSLKNGAKNAGMRFQGRTPSAATAV